MASWSTTRKYGYLSALVIVLAILGGVPAFLLFYSAPTCFDGKQNGEEGGVDCGGACVKLCLADFADPRVLWSYSTRVVPGVYNSMAYVQNPNQGVEASGLPYVFKLYDAEGLLVASREGRAFVPAGQRTAIFEGAIRTGSRSPTRTTFEFVTSPEWERGESFTSLRVLSIDLASSGTPTATVRVENQALDRGFSNVDAAIVLYDKDDNRVSFSKTVIGKIAPGETQTLYFTWPEAFSSEIFRSELLFSVPKEV